MSASKNMNGEIKTQRRAMAFMGNLIGVLSLLVIGYPLAPAAIRSMLLGLSLIVAAIIEAVLGRNFQTTRTGVALMTVRSTECERHR